MAIRLTVATMCPFACYSVIQNRGIVEAIYLIEKGAINKYNEYLLPRKHYVLVYLQIIQDFRAHIIIKYYLQFYVPILAKCVVWKWKTFATCALDASRKYETLNNVEIYFIHNHFIIDVLSTLKNCIKYHFIH